MMKIALVGAEYVRLFLGTCFTESGNKFKAFLQRVGLITKRS